MTMRWKNVALILLYSRPHFRFMAAGVEQGRMHLPRAGTATKATRLYIVQALVRVHTASTRKPACVAASI